MKRVVVTRLLPAIAILWVALLVGSDALAQDPNTTAAQKVAREWLVLTDRGDAKVSWNAAGKRFQAALPAARWTAAFNRVRQPLGAVISRSMISTRFAKTLRGMPEGNYSLVVFRTSFANKTETREIVTLEREADGVWRVIGYVIS